MLALVLCGGGVAGIAWELGVLQGIADVDPALAARLVAADLVVGTSAGSTVAAQITTDASVTGWYESQLAATSSELEVDLDLTTLLTRFAAAVGDAHDEADRARRIGELALSTDTVSEPARRSVIAARLQHADWPHRDLRIPAVEARTGALVVFTRDSGVSLIDAVAASCAVPGVWPPVTIAGTRYIDGGVRSVSNADLAQGADEVLVISPTVPGQPGLWGDVEAELASLEPARALVVHADEPSVAAFGANPLAASTRGPSARAGRAVGRAAAGQVARLLEGTS